jgi:spermidine synthase
LGLFTWICLRATLREHFLSSLNLAEQRRIQVMIAYAIPLLAAFTQNRKRTAFAFCLLAICLAGWVGDETEDSLFHYRSFFGMHRVTNEKETQTHRLLHGTTTHGMQKISGLDHCEPLSYYHRKGPAGQIFKFISLPPSARLGIIGLGTGSLAPYATSSQSLTFYEIDPTIERIAKDPTLFSYLSDCVSTKTAPEVILGDARLEIAGAQNHSYQLLVVDAFSSDAIPIHLITREALSLYLSKLDSRGLMAFHISNRFTDLKEVLGNLATSLDLTALVNEDPGDESEGRFQSIWMIMGKQSNDLDSLRELGTWTAAPVDGNKSVWTDKYSNLAAAIRWN